MTAGWRPRHRSVRGIERLGPAVAGCPLRLIGAIRRSSRTVGNGYPETEANEPRSALNALGD